MSEFLKLQKGNFLNLSKGLEKVKIGLSWDPSVTGDLADLDLNLFLLKNGKLQSAEDAMFYGNPKKIKGIEKSGDNRDGKGEGDDESAIISFTDLDPSVDKIIILASIYNKVDENNQPIESIKTFITVKNAKIDLMNESTGEKLCEFSLTDDFSTEIVVEFAELIKQGQTWQFKALGNGTNNNLSDVAFSYTH